MLRVYLDQHKWIDLGRALNGNPLGARFETVAVMIVAAVEQGQASFPLSGGHFFETWKHRNAKRRHELASTMAAVSRNHAIASHWELLPGELDRALQRRFGRPVSVLPLRPFGVGLRHSMGDRAPETPESLRALVKEANPGFSDRDVVDEIDLLLLAGPPEDLPVAGIAPAPVAPAENFANTQNEQARRFAKYEADKDTRRRAVAALELFDMQKSLQEALIRAQISWEQLVSAGPEYLTNFLLDLPSRAPGIELMWWQFDNQQTEWEPNDLTDIAYLSTAVAYCDIVVTERKWTHMLNQSGVANRFGTTVINDLVDLTKLLVTRSGIPATN